VQELRGLRERREELSSQLSSAAERRSELAEELNDVDPLARPGLQERIAVLDGRIVQLESDLAETGRQLAATPIALVGSVGSRPPSGLDSETVTTVGGLFTVFVLAPLAFAFAWRMLRRARPARPALAESSQRFDRIEQAIEAVAIEVERISEGQRFVTRVLTEGNRLPTLAAGKREQESVRKP
jgi:FtsZ-binding cell division protein ZapB